MAFSLKLNIFEFCYIEQHMTAFMTGWVTHVSRVLKVYNLNPAPTKSYTALQTVCHHFNNYASCVALELLYVAEIGTTKLLYAFDVQHNTI